MDSHQESQASEEQPRSALRVGTLETAAHKMGRLPLVLLVFGTLMAGFFAAGMLPRWQKYAQLNIFHKVEKTNAPKVQTVTVQRQTTTKNLVLPGKIEALEETSIYSRANGYLSKRLVNVGDRVQAGQLLAEIESPEMDQQLTQARAQLAQSRSNHAQARANLQQARSALLQVQSNSDIVHASKQRWQDLQLQGAVSRQYFDEKQAALKVSEADVRSAQSVIDANLSNVDSAMANVTASEENVRRLEAMQSYKGISAPVNGVITAAKVDPGEPVTVGSSGSNAVWLYKIAQPDTLQVYVKLPRTDAESMRPGHSAKILVKEFPQQVFSGKVTRIFHSLDVTSQTLLSEIKIPNPNLKLLPGMHAQVKLSLNRVQVPFVVPANTIVMRADGPQVAVVDKNQKVQYQKVTIKRNHGNRVEIASGLKGDEQLIVNPTDNLTPGVRVRAVAAQQKPHA